MGVRRRSRQARVVKPATSKFEETSKGGGRDLLVRKLKALDLLNQISHELASEISPERVVERILKVAHDAMGFSHCAVLLLNADRTALCVEAAVGYGRSVTKSADGQRCLLFSQGVTGRVASTERAELVPDVGCDPSYIEGVSGGRCEMAAPLKCRGKLLGVLDAESTEAGAFDEIDLETFVAFADQAALALHNATLYREARDVNATLERALSALADANERLEQHVSELAALNEVAREITAKLSISDTIASIGHLMHRVIDIDGGELQVLGDGNGRATATVAIGGRGGADAGCGSVCERVELCTALAVGSQPLGFLRVWRGANNPFRAFEQQTFMTFANQAAVALDNARLFEHTQATYLQVIRSLAEALEARDPYTKGHSERVMKYSLMIANAYGLTDDRRDVIKHAALLHDIGKIGIRDNVLLKPMRLTEEEWKLIEGHPAHADRILAPIQFLDEVRLIVRAHHERFDGTGFPEGLAGADIPLGARIIAVADAFDAMTTDRPYRKGMETRLALSELSRHAGTQFDPDVVEQFARSFEERLKTVAEDDASSVDHLN